MVKVTTLGAIDIGSNAIRLQINNVEQYASETVFKKVSWVRVPLRLGEDVFSTDATISAAKIEKLQDIMSGFSHLMRAFNVERYRACATSAMREATNGQDVVKMIAASSGIDIEIVSGAMEAQIVFDGGLREVMGNTGSFLFVDVGGGSTELTVFSDGHKVDSRSFAVGTVRMLQNMVGETVMKDMKKWLKFQMLKYAPSMVMGSGGNISKVARMLSKKEKDTMNYAEIKVLNDYIESFSFEERVHTLRLNAHRADVIVPAMKIFLTVMKCCKINEVMVPKIGMTEGVIRDLYYNDEGNS